MTHGQSAGPSRRERLREAAVTLAAVLLAFAAFDDITTDNATTFTFEWVGLAACGMCLGMVSWRLLRREDWWLGSVSVVALVAGVSAGSSIRPGTGPFQFGSVATMAALLWFLGLVVILAGQGWQRGEEHAA